MVFLDLTLLFFIGGGKGGGGVGIFAGKSPDSFRSKRVSGALIGALGCAEFAHIDYYARTGRNHTQIQMGNLLNRMRYLEKNMGGRA